MNATETALFLSNADCQTDLAIVFGSLDSQELSDRTSKARECTYREREDFLKQSET